SLEQVKIEDAVGRVAGEDVFSGIEMPPFDKSAMDGYALKYSDLKNIPGKLKCIGLIQAGDIFNKKLQRNECVKIMTGAPLPPGADSVVMVEDTSRRGNFVEILKTVKKGGNVCRRGEDLKRRQKVFARGTVISSSHIAVLAAVGRSSLKVYAQPKVAVLNTGGEIVPVGTKLGRNKIYNSNGPMLAALLKSDKINPWYLGIAKDKVKDLKAAIRKGLNSDILLISGGVSMGDFDLVPEVLSSLGVRMIFYKVRIKPGKPLFYGKKGKTLVFGIPGNPVSTFLAYQIFIRPAVYKMLGYECSGPVIKSGIAKKRFLIKSDRKQFVLVKIERKQGNDYLTALSGHGSADILSLSHADGFMVVSRQIEKGAKVNFITWKKN
ncbi:MAG: gephyrin-like molybdotransferase Glp, partial [Candidatus Omnitrophota bacterium]